MTEPITIRTVLREPLPLPLPVLGGGAGIPAALGAGAGAPATGLPHLLQKLVPSARVAPQELQKAITHL
jgi:hypothetical protein